VKALAAAAPASWSPSRIACAGLSPYEGVMTRPPSIVILTGAGISKESGLDTFRDPDGIWSKVRIEDVATPEAFARDPARVHAFYNMRRRRLLDPSVQPNAAHHALVRLERERRPAGDVLLVTQNTDDLHERAGSGNLIHMHGELRKAICAACGHIAEQRGDLDAGHACAACGRDGRLRPRVVWFGERPLEMDRVYEALASCDLFVSIGTSGNVYPAAGFVQEARAAGARTVELNLEPSEGASLFDEAIHGPATVIVPAFVEQVLAAERR
jgi:NAD-dependent deacetylase